MKEKRIQQNKKVNVGIIGHTGRLGRPLVDILSKHPYAKIVYTNSRKQGRTGNLSDAEFVFLAMNHGESRNYLQYLEGKKIIDLSIDHRCIDGWVYGLPEFNKNQIKTAGRVANPGCYATSVLEALLPIKYFVRDIEIKAYSGVSGRPNQLVIENKRIERYAKSREHSQVKEVENCLGKQIKSFEPHLVYPLETEIVAIINAELNDCSQISNLFKNSFENMPFIKLVDFQLDRNININYLKRNLKGLLNSNYCHISFKTDGKFITIISTLDNLIKGGSGQAVQNFNIMYGFDEKTGLANC